MKHWAWFATLAALGAAADLLSKHLAFRAIGPNDPGVVVIEGFFEIGRTFNPGIVFGIAPAASRVFLWVAILAVPAIIAIFASLRRPQWVMTASLGLILGGTIGNMVDRIEFGKVRDFIKFYWWPGREWPMFNIADSCICVGVVLLSLEMLFFDEKKPAPPPPVPQGPTEPMPRLDEPPAAATEPIPTRPPDSP